MLTLTAPELRELTGVKTPDAQRRVLDELGIPWKEVRGRTIALHLHVQSWMEGKPLRRSAEPQMDRVR